MERNAVKKKMRKKTALLLTLTKVVNSPILLARLTNRPYEMLNEYYSLTAKEKAVLIGELISRF